MPVNDFVSAVVEVEKDAGFSTVALGYWAEGDGWESVVVAKLKGPRAPYMVSSPCSAAVGTPSCSAPVRARGPATHAATHLQILIDPSAPTPPKQQEAQAPAPHSHSAHALAWMLRMRDGCPGVAPCASLPLAAEAQQQ